MRWARNSIVVVSAVCAVGCRSADDAAAPPNDDLNAVDVAAEFEEVDTSGWSVEAEADAVLRAAGDLLARTQRFSFRAEVMEEEVLEWGAKYDTSREGTVHVRRPDGLLVVRHDATGERRLTYDGRAAALLDVPTNLYVLDEAPPATLDEFLDHLVERLDVAIPLGDVIVADPYAAMREPAIGGVHFGEALVRGARCHHLGFGNGEIEWQIWVQVEGRPLIRKAVINYRDELGSPRWEAHLSDWNLDDNVADAVFTFQPPEGAHRIALAEMETDAEYEVDGATGTENPGDE